MKRLFTIFTVIFLTLTAGGLVLAQSNPFVGTWKLNLAKSKYDPGPPPKSQTRTWDASGKVSVEGVGATGKPMAYGYTLKNDGKDYPTTGAIPNGAETVATKQINANTLEANFMRGGKHAETTRFVVSKDGKVLTITAKGSLASGESFNNLIVWDKQ
jgi:hypothetical protein